MRGPGEDPAGYRTLRCLSARQPSSLLSVASDGRGGGDLMSLFMFSILTGLLLHQVVSVIQPIAGSRSYKFGGRIVIELPEKTFVMWKVGALVVAILLFLLLVIIIVAQSVHPGEGYAYRFAD